MVQARVQLEYTNYNLYKELHSLLALHWFYNSISVIFAELHERYYLYVQ